MDTGRRRSGVRVSVAAGSVWESRMQTDDVKGGIFKAFDSADDEYDDNKNNNNKICITNDGDQDNEKKSKKEVPVAAAVSVSGKRKTWNSDFPDDDQKNPIQIGRAKADHHDQCRKTPLKLTRPRSNLSVPTKTTPQKLRSEAASGVGRRPKSGSPESNEKSSPVSSKKLIRSESVEGNERTPIRFRKARSDLSKENVKCGDHHKPESSSISAQLRKSYSSPAKNNSDEPKKVELSHEDEKPVDPLENDEDEPAEEKEQSTDEVKEFGVCQEAIITVSSNKDEQIDGKGDEDKDEGETEEFVDGSKEEAKKEEEEEVDEEIEIEKKSIDVEEKNVIKQTDNKVLKEIGRFHNNFHDRAAPSSSNVNRLNPPVTKRATAFYSAPPSEATVSDDEYQNIRNSQGKLQSLVDLVMWKDASRSALVFGMGTFLTISSSYATDLEISLVSVVSYMGLVYLAAIFMLRTVIHRGYAERKEYSRHGKVDDNVVMVREEEALWLLRLLLPYLNELLLKLRALFCGDPATTLKLGVVLFVMARCGSSITIWKMAKLGFFGVFILPKIFTAYSTYLSAYANFWMRRFWDAWESCSHKKAVAFTMFTLVWNLSSVVARVWAAFMLFVALRYYQQKMVEVNDAWRDDGDGEEDEEDQQEEEDAFLYPKKLKGIATPSTMSPQSPSPNLNRIFLPNKLKKMY